MTRLMRDSTDPNAIPLNTPMVAGYVDCSFVWSAAGWARFPNAVKVRIAAGCNPQDAQVADVENGDYLPWESVDFVLAQRAKGIDPTVYTFYDNWAPTQTEFRLRGVPEPHWWIALFDGVMQLLPGTVASQRRNGVYTGADYDESVVADFWPGVDSAAGGGGGVATDPTYDIVSGAHDHAPKTVTGLAMDIAADTRGNGAYSTIDLIGARLGIHTIAYGTAPGQVVEFWKDPGYPSGGGGTEPPEPAEPTSGTLHVPAQDIPISFS